MRLQSQSNIDETPNELFRKQDEEEDHTSLTSVHVKDSSGDGDYYVNDYLFPNSTTVQAAQSSNHSDEQLTNNTNARLLMLLVKELKSTSKPKSDPNNYRPISLTSILHQLWGNLV